MKIAIAGFRGEMPIVDERLLPDTTAQVARNVYLRRGTLKPERSAGPLQVRKQNSLEAQQPAVSGFFIALK